MREKIDLGCCQCGNRVEYNPLPDAHLGEDLLCRCFNCKKTMRFSWDDDAGGHFCSLCDARFEHHQIGPFLVSHGEDIPCPRCKKLLDISAELKEFRCPHCGASLVSEEVQPPMQVLPCALCREMLEIPVHEPLERFPCPHCEGLLEYVSQDPYRNNAPQVSSPRCECGGILRFSRGEEPLLNIGGVLGLGAVNLDRLLAAGGAPKESAPVQCYRCEECGKAKQFQAGS